MKNEYSKQYFQGFRRCLSAPFCYSFTSSAILKQQAWFVPGNIGETMLKIADSQWIMRTTILLDMLTALGVTFLGVILFLTLR
jgi:hypothetical protein